MHRILRELRPQEVRATLTKVRETSVDFNPLHLEVRLGCAKRLSGQGARRSRASMVTDILGRDFVCMRGGGFVVFHRCVLRWLRWPLLRSSSDQCYAALEACGPHRGPATLSFESLQLQYWTSCRETLTMLCPKLGSVGNLDITSTCFHPGGIGKEIHSPALGPENHTILGLWGASRCAEVGT